MLVIRPYCTGHVWLRKDCHRPIGFRCHRRALDVLGSALTKFFRGLDARAEELSTRMFGKHTFAERAKLLPLKATVLGKCYL